MEKVSGQRGHNNKTRSKHGRLAGSLLLAGLVPASIGINDYHSAYREAGQTKIFEAPQPKPNTPGRIALRMLTWNIHQGKTADGLDNIPQVIAQLQAQKDFDIACLQEAREKDVKRIVKALGNYHAILDPTYVSVNTFGGNEGGRPGTLQVEGNVILISSSLTNVSDIRAESRQLYQANSSLAPRSVTVANMGHVAAYNNLWVVATHLEAKRKSVNQRQAREMVQFVQTSAEIEDRVVGCADFNAEPESSLTSSIINGVTMNMVSMGVTFGMTRQIDGFLTDLRSTVTGGEVVTSSANISDHMLSSMTVRLIDEPA